MVFQGNILFKMSFSHYIFFLDQEKVAKVLIQMGANVSARDDKYFTPLHLAAMEGKI